ncbi:MAG: HEAT repeat domain-containing protein [Pirellulales bacterium]|nr:HEAT repeat domain-containing protein [Pirellulales bacterium]
MLHSGLGMLLGLLLLGADPHVTSPAHTAPTLENYKRQLADKDPAVRAAAVEGLPHANLPSQDVVVLLAKAATDRDVAVRRSALDALGHMGRAARAAVPVLVKALASKDLAERYEALYALGRLGAAAKVAQPQIEALLNNDDAFTQVVAAWALVRIQARKPENLKRQIPLLVGALGNKDATIRREVISALAEIGAPAVAELSAALGKAKTPTHASAVLSALAAIGPSAAPAVGGVQGKLTDEDVEVRWHAARALASIGQEAEAAVPELVKLLGDSEPRVRWHAAHALGKIPAAGQSAVEPLIKAISDSDPHVRRAAVVALRTLKPDPTKTLPLLVKLLDSSEPQVVAQVLDTLAESGEQAVPFLQNALNDEKGRYWACLVIVEIGPPAKATVPGLTQATADKAPEVRMQALNALASIGADSASAINEMIKALDDPVQPVRTSAAYALGSLGPAGKEALPELTKRIADGATGEDKLLPAVCAWAMVRIAPDDTAVTDAAVPVLVRSLQARDVPLEGAQAAALGQLKSAAAVVAPALLKAVPTASPAGVGNLLSALHSLGVAALPALEAGLADPETRGPAAAVIHELGAEAKPSAGALIKALADERPEVRREVLFALAAVGTDTKAIPVLLKSLGDPAEDVRHAAAFALGRMGPTAKAAIAPLKEHLENHGDDVLCLVCAWALVQIDPAGKDTAKIALPHLIEGLSSQVPMVRREAADALGDLGARAREAVPVLTELLTDSDPTVAEAAKDALARINKK